MTQFLSDEVCGQLSPSLPNDEFYMTLALDEASKGRLTTRPNPCVGCVIVKDDVIIGKGFHPKAGYPHAEVFATNHAKEQGIDITGASVYVTLEPCSHTGRTPPCVDMLIKERVGRVVIACADPNPQVAGQGIAKLLNAGIMVTLGVREKRARALNAGFLKAMATGLPYVRLKMGISLDGRIAMSSGKSKWITGQMARADVQYLRAISGAIITGSGTIIADNPKLNVRLADVDLPIGKTAIPQPKIVVLDRSHRLDTDDDYVVFQNSDGLIWRDDLVSLLKTLVAEYQCYDVLVEAGATLATAFLEQGLIDELVVYQAPCLLGATARPMFLGQIDTLSDKLDFTLTNVERLGNDIKLVFVKRHDKLSTTQS